MATTTLRYLSYPADASGVTVTGGTAMLYGLDDRYVEMAVGNYTQVVPASTITSDCYVAGVSYTLSTPVPSAFSTYSFNLQLGTGTSGSEVVFAEIPCSLLYASAAGYLSSYITMLPEPKLLAANTRLAARVGWSRSTLNISGLKIIYQIT